MNRLTNFIKINCCNSSEIERIQKKTPEKEKMLELHEDKPTAVSVKVRLPVKEFPDVCLQFCVVSNVILNRMYITLFTTLVGGWWKLENLPHFNLVSYSAGNSLIILIIIS